VKTLVQGPYVAARVGLEICDPPDARHQTYHWATMPTKVVKWTKNVVSKMIFCLKVADQFYALVVCC